MKTAIISDIHANRAALEAVLDDIDQRGIKAIINLGDSLSGPLDAPGTADLLIARDIPTICGNHDRQLIDRPKEEMGLWETWVIDDLTPAHLAWVRSLPKTLRINDMLFCHGTIDDDDEMWLHVMGPDARMICRNLNAVTERLGATDATFIACGHTHTPAFVRLPNGPAIVNPGSIGCPAFADTRCNPPFVQQVGAPDARYAIAEKVDEVWRTELVAVPYDPSEMARLARAKGEDSWARALETGWLA